MAAHDLYDISGPTRGEAEVLASRAHLAASNTHGHIVIAQQHTRRVLDDVQQALIAQLGGELREVAESIEDSASDGRYTPQEAARDLRELGDCIRVAMSLRDAEEAEVEIHALVAQHLDGAHAWVDGWPTACDEIARALRNRKLGSTLALPEVPTCQLRLIDEEGDE